MGSAGGFILKRNERLEVSVALINRRCKNDVPKCSVPPCHSNLFAYYRVSINSIFFYFSRSCKVGVHL